MKFFFDRNISVHIARMIGHFDRQNIIVHQDDDSRFQSRDDDVHLIETIGSETPRPIRITADINQRREPTERAALASSGMHVVFFKRLHRASFHDQAVKVLMIWPTLCDLCSTAREPTAFEVPAGPLRSRKVTRLGTSRELLLPR